MKSQFEKELTELINKHSEENNSNTPDFILAKYLNNALEIFNTAIVDREQWYCREKHVEDQKIPFPTEEPPFYDNIENIPPNIFGLVW